jgi:cell division protein FtsZ
MSINIGPPAVDELRPRITVIGVGGAGGNAIANMIHAGIEGVDFVVTNTDAQALNNSIAEHRIQLGPDITQGLGAGSRPEVGRAAAEETLIELERALEGVHMCFIAAGMGGGTGTGAAPVIAEIARRKGVLTVGVVTKPFLFEGTRRMRAAEAGIDELQKHVDTLIVIPNQNLFLVAKAETTFKEAFQLADEVLQQGVRSITDLMVMPGLINLDFADVRSVMAEMGKAMMGTGEGEGPHRALEAAEKAIANPLLDGVSMQGAKGVIISIIGGDDMRLLEVDEAANHIRDLVDPNANIIWGSAFNPDLNGKIRVSVVATGIEQTAVMAEEASRPFSMGAARGPARPPVAAAPPASELPLRAAPPRAETPPAAAERGAQAGEGAPAGQGASPAPVVTEHEPLELSVEDEADDGPIVAPAVAAAPVSAPASASAQASPRFKAQDEFMLDARRLANDEPAAESGLRRRQISPLPGATVPAPQPDAATPARLRTSQEPPARPAANGGTLFERMASLTGRRKVAEADEDEGGEGGAINVPRFLGRQNNQ